MIGSAPARWRMPALRPRRATRRIAASHRLAGPPPWTAASPFARTVARARRRCASRPARPGADRRTLQDRLHPAHDRPVGVDRQADRGRDQALASAERHHRRRPQGRGDPQGRRRRSPTRRAGSRRSWSSTTRSTCSPASALTPLGARDRADRDPEQDADGRDRGGDVERSPTTSPYIVRTSFTLPQATVPIADWAAKNGIKKVVTFVADYGPGIDAEKFFKSQFQLNGGQVTGEIRSPLRSPDFAPFLQKVADLKPDARVLLPAVGPGRGVHEAVRRARPRQVGHQADRHRRRHRRRPAQRHGRRRARRRQLAPLLGGASFGDEQEVRAGVRGGQQRSVPTSWPSPATTACT